jgi:hypothetical protein
MNRPKPDRFVKEGDRPEVEGRQLDTMPRNLAITHAGLLNPNFVKELGYWRKYIKAALNNVGQRKHADAHKKWYGKHPERATTSSARIEERDSMLVVSTSTKSSTAFHYDQGDAGKPFTCLERTVY